MAKYTGQLRGQRVLIVGGTSGIGLAVAEAALEHDALVTIVGSNPDKLSRALTILEQWKGRVDGIARDLANGQTLEANVLEILKFATQNQAHQINHVVITAADMATPPSILEVTPEGVQASHTIRVLMPLLLAKHLPRFMDCSSPANSLTLTSGAHGRRPDPGWAVIAAYCGAVESLAKALAIDLRPLRVNVVSPGAIITDAVKEILGEAYGAVLELAAKKSLVGSAGQAEHVAQAYLYLLKDRYASGEVVSTNGGMLLV